MCSSIYNNLPLSDIAWKILGYVINYPDVFRWLKTIAGTTESGFSSATCTIWMGTDISTRMTLTASLSSLPSWRGEESGVTRGYYNFMLENCQKNLVFQPFNFKYITKYYNPLGRPFSSKDFAWRVWKKKAKLVSHGSDNSENMINDTKVPKIDPKVIKFTLKNDTRRWFQDDHRMTHIDQMPPEWS